MVSEKRRRTGTTAGELLSQLSADPEFQRQKAERDADLERRTAVLRLAEQPIVADLWAAGYEVSSVWDLVNTSTPYPNALPVLLDHLSRGGYPDRVMESLGRALAVRPASFAWFVLRDLYVRAKGPGEREGLAVALAASATAEHFDALVALLEDEGNDNRIHFLQPIKDLGGERGVEVLERHSGDPLFAGEVKNLLRAPRARRTPAGEQG